MKNYRNWVKGYLKLVKHSGTKVLSREDNTCRKTENHFFTKRLGGGGLSESMDGRGCAILALELVPKNLIFAKNPTQKFILQDFKLTFQRGKLEKATNFVSHE